MFLIVIAEPAQGDAYIRTLGPFTAAQVEFDLRCRIRNERMLNGVLAWMASGPPHGASLTYGGETKWRSDDELIISIDGLSTPPGRLDDLLESGRLTAPPSPPPRPAAAPGPPPPGR